MSHNYVVTVVVRDITPCMYVEHALPTFRTVRVQIELDESLTRGHEDIAQVIIDRALDTKQGGANG